MPACLHAPSQCPIKVDVNPPSAPASCSSITADYLRGPRIISWAPSKAMRPARQGPKLVNFFLEKWAQKATEKSIGMVDVPLLSADPGRGCVIPRPLLRSAGARGHEPEQRQKWCVLIVDPFTSYHDAPWCA